MVAAKECDCEAKQETAMEEVEAEISAQLIIQTPSNYYLDQKWNGNQMEADIILEVGNQKLW